MAPISLPHSHTTNGSLPNQPVYTDSQNHKWKALDYKDIDSLPQEMWEHIFRNADLPMCASLASVCLKFRAYIIPGIIEPGTLKNCCEKAAGLGYLNLLSWARANGCSWDALTFAFAAKGGHLEVLKWLKENGCPWDTSTFTIAAYVGELEILKWLKENGCPWDEVTFACAVRGGRINVLEWFKDNHCPWDLITVMAEAQQASEEVNEWLEANILK